MKGIGIENDIIMYYGNAAGYISGDVAVVDPLFEAPELKDFLARQRQVSKVKWTDGVFDRLSNGQRKNNEITPLKNCRIWQLKPESDIMMRFIGYDKTVEKFGEPDLQNYVKVYEGQVETNDLEGIYAKFNMTHPEGFTGHSLSISDVVELYDDIGSEFYYVDQIGFTQIDFEPPVQTQSMQI